MVAPATTEPAPLATRRYAEWYPSPVAEVHAPLNWRILWNRTNSWRKVIFISTLIHGLVLLSFASRHRDLAAAFCSFFTAFFWLIPFDRQPQPAIDLTGIAPCPLPADHFGCSITLKASGISYGTDTGAIAVSDGWLVFEGAHCHFSIKPSDALYGGRDSTSLLIRLFNRTSLQITILPNWQNGDDNVTGNIWRSETYLRNWCLGKSDPEGESVLPPRTPLAGHGLRVNVIPRLVAGFAVSTITGLVFWGAGFDAVAIAWIVGVTLAAWLCIVAEQANRAVALKRALKEIADDAR